MFVVVVAVVAVVAVVVDVVSQQEAVTGLYRPRSDLRPYI